jgi:hypothetical protein
MFALALALALALAFGFGFGFWLWQGLYLQQWSRVQKPGCTAHTSQHNVDIK